MMMHQTAPISGHHQTRIVRQRAFQPAEFPEVSLHRPQIICHSPAMTVWVPTEGTRVN